MLWKKNCLNVSHGSKLIWKIIKEVTDLNCWTKDAIICIIDKDKEINVNDDPIIASNKINTIFINIGKNLLNKFYTIYSKKENSNIFL